MVRKAGPLLRGVLNEFESKVNTFSDLQNALPSLWQYCTLSWARFCEKNVDRNHNQSRATISPFWKSLAEIEWQGVSSIQRKKRRPNKSREQLLQNAGGMLMSVAAFDDPHPEDIDHIIGVSTKLVKQELEKRFEDDQQTFAEKMQRKRNEIFTNI